MVSDYVEFIYFEFVYSYIQAIFPTDYDINVITTLYLLLLIVFMPQGVKMFLSPLKSRVNEADFQHESLYCATFLKRYTYQEKTIFMTSGIRKPCVKVELTR